MDPKGILIIIEGNEGCGKDTVIDSLLSILDPDKFIFTREPGGTPEGKLLRQRLMHEKMPPEQELELFFQDRQIHMDQVILPAIRNGINVICNRAFPSTYAYQIIARERLDLEMLFHELCYKVLLDETGGPLAETRIIHLKVRPEEGLRRKEKSSEGICTKFDAETLDFHKRVAQGFESFFEDSIYKGLFFRSVTTIDTEAAPLDEIKKQALQAVLKITRR